MCINLHFYIEYGLYFLIQITLSFHYFQLFFNVIELEIQINELKRKGILITLGTQSTLQT